MDQGQAETTQKGFPLDDAEKRPDNDSRARRQTTSATTVQPPKPLTTRQRWDAYRPSKMVLLWSIVGAVALTMLIGFTWGGWMTTANAQKVAVTSASNAVIGRLAPICVAQFNLDPEKDQKLVALREANTYDRAKYVSDQSWATMSGDEQPDRKVADACVKLLMEIEQ